MRMPWWVAIPAFFALTVVYAIWLVILVVVWLLVTPVRAVRGAFRSSVR